VQFNNVFLYGNITFDTELTTTKSGQDVVNFRIANNQGKGDSQTTNFMNVSAWGAAGAAVDRWCSKGDLVLVSGRIRTDSYEGNDGVKRNKCWIDSNNVQFIKVKSFLESGGVTKEDAEAVFETSTKQPQEEQTPF
jgi:single-strand DNA-binding protein